MIQELVEPPRDMRYEVVNGVWVEKPLALIESIIASNLAGDLATYCKRNRLGRVMAHALFTLPNSRSDRRPEVAFLSFARWPANRPVPRSNAWPVVPDLAVEVISPTDGAFDVIEKVQEYFTAGVRQVWHVYSHIEQVVIFDSATTARVITRTDELTAEPVVPGFRMAACDLFPLAESRK